MGCCISKCKPNKNSIQDINLVQDKLVTISQPPKIIPKTPLPISNKISPISPPSPATSTTSVSSFSCSNNSNTSITSSSSLSSGSSSILNSKDRSFSNEFLLSCFKENPHIIRMNSIKEYSQFLVPKNLDSPIIKQDLASINQPIPQKVVKNTSTPQKRLRSNSPTPLNRTKSFRRESDRIVNSSHLQSRTTLRSPSPSRRFNNGDHSCSKRIVGSNNKVNNTNGANSVSSSSSSRKESFRIRPYVNSNHHHSHHLRSCLKNRETFIHRISSKIDEVAVQEALAQHDSGSIPIEEDIDNPLISLDCFIFL